MSIRPSPSLSIPSEHCVGAGVVVVEGALGVVVVAGGIAVEVADPGSEGGFAVLCEPPRAGRSVSVTEESGRAAVALPTAARPRKAASARISASLLFMRLI
jgi:hypothetical protein